MKAGWKTRMDERLYFEAKLASRQPKPKPKRAKLTKTEAALREIAFSLDNIIELQSLYAQKIVNELRKHNNRPPDVSASINSLGKDLRVLFNTIEQNLIAIYGAMPPEQMNKDIRIMRDALVSMRQGLPTHRDLQLAAERANG